MISCKCTEKDSKKYRNQNYFYNRKYHCPEGYFHPGTCQNVHKKWSHNRSSQSGNDGHSYWKCNITACNIGDHIAGCSTRTASHKNHTQSQICGKIHNFTQYPGYDWHDRILCNCANDHFLWSGKNCPEVFQTYGQSHTKHDHAQKNRCIICHPCKSIPPEKGKAWKGNDDDSNISGCKTADFSYFL